MSEAKAQGKPMRDSALHDPANDSDVRNLIDQHAFFLIGRYDFMLIL
jgi:hypothetical protein